MNGYCSKKNVGGGGQALVVGAASHPSREQSVLVAGRPVRRHYSRVGGGEVDDGHDCPYRGLPTLALASNRIYIVSLVSITAGLGVV